MITGNEPTTSSFPNYGLTIRQHFAAMAMQGMVSNPEIQKLTSLNLEGVAIESVAYANALIKELNKTE